jgi:hypothetical protein
VKELLFYEKRNIHLNKQTTLCTYLLNIQKTKFFVRDAEITVFAVPSRILFALKHLLFCSYYFLHRVSVLAENLTVEMDAPSIKSN